MFTIQFNRKILKIAAVHSILWGFLVSVMPNVLLQLFGVEASQILEFLQLLGMFTCVAGIGYYIASSDSSRYWPIVLIGFLGKLLGAFLFARALISGSLPPLFATLLLISTVIWLIPFYYILLAAYDKFAQEDGPSKQFDDLVRLVRTSQGKTLTELSKDKKVLLIFVRQLGCTFCRETVSEISKIDKETLDKKFTIVFVHMSDPAYGNKFFSRYYNHPIHHISDPGRMLYRSLNLRRGSLNQIFGPRNLLRGLYAGFVKGHKLGAIEGDYLQLGGVFILANGHVVYEQKAKSASDIFQITALPEI